MEEDTEAATGEPCAAPVPAAQAELQQLRVRLRRAEAERDEPLAVAQRSAQPAPTPLTPEQLEALEEQLKNNLGGYAEATREGTAEATDAERVRALADLAERAAQAKAAQTQARGCGARISPY